MKHYHHIVHRLVLLLVLVPALQGVQLHSSLEGHASEVDRKGRNGIVESHGSPRRAFRISDVDLHCNVFTYWNFPGGAPFYAKVNLESWSLHLQGHCEKVVLLNDTNVADLIPDLPEEYHRIPDESSKADLVRSAVLFHHGGIFLETNMLAARSLTTLLQRVEAQDFVASGTDTLVCERGQFATGFLAARRGSPLMRTLWEDQKAMLRRPCHIPPHASFSEFRTLASSREVCCPQKSKEVCHVPPHSLGSALAQPAVKAAFQASAFNGFCLENEESFAPRHLSYIVEHLPRLKDALSLWSQVRERQPLDRFFYQLPEQPTGPWLRKKDELFDNSTLLGALYQWSFDDSQARVRSEKANWEGRLAQDVSAPADVQRTAGSSRRTQGSRAWLGTPAHSPCAPPFGHSSSRTAAAESSSLSAAVEKLCHEGHEDLLEAWIASGFESTYRRAYHDGWVDEAFVNYLAARPHSRLAWQAEELIISVHNYSTRPIVLVDFSGEALPETWTSSRFPRLIILRAKPLQMSGISFNFNKLRAMVLAQVRVGIELDADQWVFRGVDNLFQRTSEEVTHDYPYPILPVHWMSRDPEVKHAYSAYDFFCEGCPRRTLRWGHAHPTWTYHALPFIGQLLAAQIDGSDILGFHVHVAEDEDLFNVGLWAVGAWKQWCKFDILGPVSFLNYMEQSRKKSKVAQFSDKKWFPCGIPMVYYTAHATKKLNQSAAVLRKLWDMEQLPLINYRSRWFSSAEMLMGFDDTLNCLV
mmetsp:Transcript_38637/g.90788  ORF Transcript_38637/g.90788 Transcript_38637/m.90788 type:complete len:755 (+) Transcript_38637:3-2267(+)